MNIIQSLGLVNNNFFDLNIYPNPANSNFITIKSIFQGIKIVDIFDVNGRKLLSTSIYKDELDISYLKPGFYFVKVKINNKTITSKLIIE